MHGIAWLEWLPGNHFAQVIFCFSSNLILKKCVNTFGDRGVPTGMATKRFTLIVMFVDDGPNSNQ